MSEPANIVPATPAAIEAAAALLRRGALVAFPTETVYGLGADACNEAALAAIFAAKGRPHFNPLIIHAASLEEVERFAPLGARARSLARAFWPGPLTLVLRRPPDSPIGLLASAGLDTLALRVPAHPVAQSLLKAFGGLLAAPSANLSGTISPTTARHVADSLGDRVKMILDGGPCAIGLESTIVDVTGLRAILLRPGGISRAALEKAIGTLDDPAQGDVRAPGMLTSHYAPRLPVRLNVMRLKPGEALLAFGPAPLPGAAATLNLSAAGNLEEAAAHLFAHLRALDRADAKAIAVMPIPEHGLGEAINDRLRRAAAPREMPS